MIIPVRCVTAKCPTFFEKIPWKSGTLLEHLPKTYYFWIIIKQISKKVGHFGVRHFGVRHYIIFPSRLVRVDFLYGHLLMAGKPGQIQGFPKQPRCKILLFHHNSGFNWDSFKVWSTGPNWIYWTAWVRLYWRDWWPTGRCQWKPNLKKNLWRDLGSW